MRGAPGNFRTTQVYVYCVRSLDDPSLVIYIPVPSNGSATIKDLPLGKYSVTQESGWSWRFNAPPAEEIQHTAETTVTFDKAVSIRKWLSDATSILKIKKGG